MRETRSEKEKIKSAPARLWRGLPAFGEACPPLWRGLPAFGGEIIIIITIRVPIFLIVKFPNLRKSDKDNDVKNNYL